MEVFVEQPRLHCTGSVKHKVLHHKIRAHTASNSALAKYVKHVKQHATLHVKHFKFCQMFLTCI